MAEDWSSPKPSLMLIKYEKAQSVKFLPISYDRQKKLSNLQKKKNRIFCLFKDTSLSTYNKIWSFNILYVIE